MKTKITLFTVFILFTFSAFSQSFKWVKKYYTTSEGAFNCIIVSNDHNYISCGQLDYKGFIMKTDTAGNEMWSKAYQFMRNINQVENTFDGNLVIYGPSDTTQDYYFIKMNATGDTLWRKKFKCDYSRNNQNFIQTIDSGFVLTYSQRDTIHLVKMDKSGNILWSKIYLGMQFARSQSISLTKDSGFVIGANTYSDNTKSVESMLIIKTNVSGDSIWTHTFSITGFSQVASVIEMKDKNYIIAYYTGLSCSYKSYIRKIDSAGNVIWNYQNLLGGSSAFAWSLYRAPDDNYVIAGAIKHFNEGTGYDYTIDWVDSTGSEPWVLNYRDSAFDYCNSIAFETDSILITAGLTNNSANNILTIAKISIIPVITDILEPVNNSDIKIYPNPSAGNVVIIVPEATENISIINAVGQEVYSLKTNRKTKFDFTITDEGIYFIRVEAKNQIFTKKLIVNE